MALIEMGSVDVSNPLRGTPADEQRYGDFETFEVQSPAPDSSSATFRRVVCRVSRSVARSRMPCAMTWRFIPIR